MALTLHGTVSDNTVALDRKTVPPIFINGDMAIWQRGTALASSSGNYACDRFWYSGTGMTSQRSTDVPSGFVYSNKLTYGSADMAIGQPIELPATGKQGIFISGQTVTIAFYGKVDSGTEAIGLAINFRNGKFDGTDQQAFTISDNAVTLTTAWQRFTKTFTIPTVHANNIMMAFEINGIGKTAYFTGMQCELGTYDTNNIADFQFEDRATSLARCQRYFLIYGGNSSHERIAQGFMFNTGQARCEIIHPCTMRSSPSVSVSSVGDWSIEGTSVVTVTSVATDQSSPRVSSINFGCSSGPTAGQAIHIMGNNTSNARLKLESEL